MPKLKPTCSRKTKYWQNCMKSLSTALRQLLEVMVHKHRERLETLHVLYSRERRRVTEAVYGLGRQNVSAVTDSSVDVKMTIDRPSSADWFHWPLVMGKMRICSNRFAPATCTNVFRIAGSLLGFLRRLRSVAMYAVFGASTCGC